MLGRTVSHFKIIEELGKGEMGLVYKAQDLKLDRIVALKFLPSHLTSDGEAKKRFLREAKAVSALDHPNICTIHEIGELPEGDVFLVLSYCEGETLEGRMEKGMMDIEEAVEIASQIGSGLHRAHERGIIHRDIKPANIMITSEGKIKILDFGVAKLTGHTILTVAGSSIGTVAYMSPEQHHGMEVDSRSDIFSLGLVLYQMLAGEHPFKAEHEAAMIYCIMNEDPPPLRRFRSDIPEALQELIGRLLEKNREKRLQSLKDISAKLKRALKSQVPAQEKDQPAEREPVISGRKGDSIGPYRLRDQIGVGGMGEVWAAEQEKPFHRKVALKILKAGMDTKEVVARFEAERQALALMDHPCIAQVYDAGSTPQGRPYFAMEFILGVPITEYCDRHKLGTEERLKLFLQLCEGVQHAHQKAVIHRDLKPGNVLVTVIDNKPVPKIIDFGVAKATAQPLTEKTMYTHLGQLIGTPDYMSPEQAELTGEDIDTRTDVYSLGVILYELLVGALPFDPTELRKAGFEGIRRIILEQEPTKPSRRITTLGDMSVIAAKSRHADPTSLSSQLKGDLDWIVMKALEKDRMRRYASASDLAADIERHLKMEPVLAGPPSNIYRIRKFIMRHKAGVAAAAFVALALILGITGTTIGLIRAIEAERVARLEAETASQVSEFLVDLFAVSDPGETRGNTITAREILDEGAERIDRDLDSQPLVQARMMVTMGRVYMRLGLFGQSRILLEGALSKYKNELEDDHIEVAISREELASLLGSIGDYDQAKSLFEQALSTREKLFGPDHPEVGKAVSNLGNLYRQMRDFEAALPLYERALMIRENALGPNHIEVSNSLNGLAIVLEATGDYESALPLYERALRIRENALGTDHPLVATSLNNIATLHWFMGNYETAHSFNERALVIQEKVLGPDHPDIAHTLNTCAILHLAMGEYDKTRRIHERALAIREKHLRPNHPRIAESYYNLACVGALQGDREFAITSLRESIRRGFSKPVIFDDPDLVSLRGDAEFESLLGEMRRRLENENP
jgi:non-specific serine/threonine protein kinase/serine/threonine-protein kinase